MVAARPLIEPIPRLYTWDDFVLLDDDDKRELIDGQLVEVEVPTKEHEHFVMMLGFFLVGWARQRGGMVLGSGYKVKIRRDRGVMPDVQYFRAGRNPPSQGLSEGAPDLAVEIMSPSSVRFDRKTKLEYYQSIGTPEYWIVDLQARFLTRHVLVDGRYVVAGSFDDTERFAPDTFPGLEIPLDEVFPKLPEPAPSAEPEPG